MEKLETALKEALSRNKDETERWTKYLDEHQRAIENIETFTKKLEVDIMVPIGTKAFIPGKLYHTNEIFVSHYRGLFSKCSAHQAKEISEHRIKMAKEHLGNLEKERDMYQNKLDVPIFDGVLPGTDEREIIEEYNEEQEKLWREEHKRKVREYKQQQSKEKINSELEKSHENIMNLLDDLELMEELDEELETIDVQDNEMLEKLLSGDIKLPEKKRTSHLENITNESNDIERISEVVKNSIVKRDNYEQLSTNIPLTNNNSIPNLVDFNYNSEESDSSDDSINNDMPEEVTQFINESSHLPLDKQIKYLRQKIKNVEKEMKSMKLQDLNDLNIKMDKIDIREYLIDYIEMLKDELNNDENSEKYDVPKSLPIIQSSDKKKKQITFALQDEIQIIDIKQAPNKVNKSQKDILKRDIIKLNDNTELNEINEQIDNIVDKKMLILEKVERNLEFITENQSQQDFDIVGKILSEEESNEYETLQITFDHSNKEFTYPGYDTENENDLDKDIIGSPADIYKVFKSYFPIEVQVTTVNDQNDKKIDVNIENPAYIDPRLEFSRISKNESKDFNDITNMKSILKNKDAIKMEVHTKDEVKKRPKNKTEKIPTLSTYEMVVGDVIENKNNELIEPEPLPEEKFIDSHTPKKRISRFKQKRQGINE